MNAFLIGVFAFLLLLLFLLALPIKISFQVSRYQVFQGHIKLRWFFGLVRVRFNPFQVKTESTEPTSKTKKTRQKKPGKKKTGVISVIRQRAFRQRVIRFLRRFWYAIHKDDMKLWLRLGLGDPAATGQLWAVVGPASGLLACNREIQVTIEPDFLDSTFELDSHGTVQFVPLRLIGLLAGLLLSPTVWRGVSQMRKA